MKWHWLFAAWGLSLCLACGVARDSTRKSDSDGPPYDAGSKPASGGVVGSGGSNAGGAASGGTPLPMGGGPAVMGAGGLATGGGTSCTGADGRMLESLKACGTDADCATLMIPGCCGGLIVGITRGKTCTPLVSTCTRALCPAVYSAEDGNNSGLGTIEVACQRLGDGGSGSCRTSVVTTPPGAP